MSLVIVDDYYKKKISGFAEEKAEILDEIIDEYVGILDNVIENGIKEGITSQALKEFKDQVISDTGKNSSTAYLIGKEAKRYCENYIMRVNKDDKDLY